MAPFFIGGWRSQRESSGTFGGMSRCSHCGRLTSWVSYEDSTHATAFFVPVLKLSSCKSVVCALCGAPASGKDIEASLEAARKDRQRRRSERVYAAPAADATLSRKIGWGLERLTWALEDVADGVDPEQARLDREAKELKAEKRRLKSISGKLAARRLRRENPAVAQWIERTSNHLRNLGYRPSDPTWGERFRGIEVLANAGYARGDIHYQIVVLRSQEDAQRFLAALLGLVAYSRGQQLGALQTAVVDRRVFMAVGSPRLARGTIEDWIREATCFLIA